MNTETKEQIKTDLAAYVAKVGGQMAASRQLSGVSNGTISNIVNGKWDNIADGMWLSIQKQVSGGVSKGLKIDRTTRRMKQMAAIYQDAKDYAQVFCVVGKEGSGKTEPAKAFATNNENVYLIKCKEHLNRKTFLADLLTAMGKDSGGYTVYEMMTEVLETIHRADCPMIIIDEADKISDQVLYFFITIYNETEGKCGIVLQATDHLKKRILKGVKMNKKGFKEIFSRIGRRFIELLDNTLEELKGIVRLNDVEEPEEVNRIANDCDGDIRRIDRLVFAYKKKQSKKGIAA